jgi:hypothetical protein
LLLLLPLLFLKVALLVLLFMFLQVVQLLLPFLFLADGGDVVNFVTLISLYAACYGLCVRRCGY